MGRTNDEILFETPTRSSTVRIFTGRVAVAELVEKAISSGLRRFLKWMAGEMRASTTRASGRVTKRWTVSPVATVRKYQMSAG